MLSTRYHLQRNRQRLLTDVYKRQENADGSFDGIAFGKKVRVRLDGERLYIEKMCIRDRYNGMLFAKTFNKFSDFDNLHRVKSVSYTHLDVYKRQNLPYPMVFINNL